MAFAGRGFGSVDGDADRALAGPVGTDGSWAEHHLPTILLAADHILPWVGHCLAPCLLFPNAEPARKLPIRRERKRMTAFPKRLRSAGLAPRPPAMRLVPGRRCRHALSQNVLRAT